MNNTFTDPKTKEKTSSDEKTFIFIICFLAFSGCCIPTGCICMILWVASLLWK